MATTFHTELTTPTDIATGAAYADLDAIGAVFSFDGVPTSGVLLNAIYIDRDDEGLQVDLLLFREQPGPQVDNGAVALMDTDLDKAIGRIQFTSFADMASGQFSTVTNLGLGYSLPGPKLYAIAQARGAINIAAANLPAFKLTILPD